MKKILSPRLPAVIKVKIIKTKEGSYIAELPKYDIFTEADSLLELDYNINDLIYTFFDMPKKYHGKIVYRKVIRKTSDLEKLNIPSAFKVFCTPDLYDDKSSWL
ncbi:MAG: hypothetical protein ABIH88_02135 [Patescibacteria group bacterium]